MHFCSNSFLAYSTSFHYIFIIEIKAFPVLILYDRTLFTFTCNPPKIKIPSALRQKVLNSLIKNKRSQQHYLTVSRSSKVIIRQFFWLKFIIHPSLPRQIPVAYFGRTHFYSDGIVRVLHPTSLLRPASPDNINMHLFCKYTTNNSTMQSFIYIYYLIFFFGNSFIA